MTYETVTIDATTYDYTYDYTYGYDTYQPHAVTSAGSRMPRASRR